MSASQHLPAVGDFSEREYLRWLAGKSSPEWRHELTIDGGVELDLHTEIEVSHLLDPLVELRFPTNRLEEIDGILESVLIGYSIGLEEGEAIGDGKLIYVASLYLYCHVMTSKSVGVTSLACALLAQQVMRLSPSERLYVFRFLLWLFGKEQAKSEYRLDFPRSSLLLCAYIIAPDHSAEILDRANAAFRTEIAAGGLPPDKISIEKSLQEAAKLDPNFDAGLVLGQIGSASPSYERSIAVFRSTFEEAHLNADAALMLSRGS
ncbi:MAG: hypothetical protein ACK4WM_11555 [Thermoflexales bacterium]